MELQEKLSNFGITLKMTSQSLRVSLEAPFYWKLLLISIVSTKWKKQNFSVLQVGGPTPAPPTPPVLRAVLLHTEEPGKDIFPGNV